MGFGRDTVTNFDRSSNDTIFLCGMEGVDYTGWPGSDSYRISVWAFEDLPYVGRTFWFQGSITLEGVELPFTSNEAPGDLKILVPSQHGVTCDTVASLGPPTVESASVNGTTLTMTFDRGLDSGSKPAGSDFRVIADGTAQTAPTGVDISGSTVTLTLSSAVEADDPVTVAYTKPTSNPLQGNILQKQVDTFTAQTVVNNTPVTAVKLVGTRGQADDGGDRTFARDIAQAFTTGSGSGGYTLTHRGPGDAQGPVRRIRPTA